MANPEAEVKADVGTDINIVAEAIKGLEMLQEIEKATKTRITKLEIAIPVDGVPATFIMSRVGAEGLKA